MCVHINNFKSTCTCILLTERPGAIFLQCRNLQHMVGVNVGTNTTVIVIDIEWCRAVQTMTVSFAASL